MALVTLTDLYANLTDWPGNLLRASDGVTIGALTATNFSYTFVSGTTFAGFTVTSTGTSFTYDGTTPTGGTMTGLTITDAGGHVVLTVAGIVAGSMASDLSMFASLEFGWSTPNGGGTSGNPDGAWSQLLSGNDTITGTAGNDNEGLNGLSAGNDTYNMGAGDDKINGSLGYDTINGGDGWDTLTYDRTKYGEAIAMVRGITVNVNAGTVADPYGATDHFTGIEQIEGSIGRDTFNGGTVGMNFEGLRGADKFVGGTSGNDWVVYSNDTWSGGARGVIVHLQTSTVGTDILGSVIDGFGNTDQTVNIHNVAGTQYNDTFLGSSQLDVFAGGEGKDFYNGGLGSDWIDLGWNFAGTPQHGVIVNLKLLTGKIVDDGFGNSETAISIENIWTGNQNDRITGSLASNSIVGNHGDDTMTGGGGHDTFQWANLADLGQQDVITDFHGAAGVEQDILKFHVSNWGATTTLNLVNGTAATLAAATFLYNVADHSLSWDADGTGAQAAIHIATLNNVLALNAANFDLF